MSLKKQNLFNEKNTSESGYHSRFYHQYFEDWSERVVRMSDGKVKVERVYTGDYYEMFFDKANLWKWKITHCVLGCFGMCLYLYGASRNTQGNLVWYVAIVQMFSLFFILWNIISIIRVFSLKQEKMLTIREYKITHIALEKSCMSGFILQEITALLLIIFGVLHQNLNQAGIWGIGAFILSGCIYFLGWRIERKVVVKKIPQEGKALEEKADNIGDFYKEKGVWFRMGG